MDTMPEIGARVSWGLLGSAGIGTGTVLRHCSSLAYLPPSVFVKYDDSEFSFAIAVKRLTLIESPPIDVFPIQKGVPIPPKPGARNKYGFRRMEVGDSITFDIALRREVRGAATKFSKRSKMNFIVRTIDDKTAGCWRTE